MRFFGILALLIFSKAVGDEFARGARTPPAQPAPLSRYMYSQVKGFVPCTGLNADPQKRAFELIQLFSQDRVGETRVRQAMCGSIADDTIKKLEGSNDALANELRLKYEFNQRALDLQVALEQCRVEGSDFKQKMGDMLARTQPFDSFFRSLPIQFKLENPPDEKGTPKIEIMNSLRTAIYSENLTLAMDNSIRLAKTHGLGTTGLTEKICPAGTPCAAIQKPRPLQQFLGTRFHDKSLIDTPRIPTAEVQFALNDAVTRINQEAKNFNQQLRCKSNTDARIGFTGPRQCFTTGSQERQAHLNTKFYARIDEITSKVEGNILDHEPYKTQLKSMYKVGMIEGLRGQLNYSRRNEPSSANWEELPENSKISNSLSDIRTAAQNSLDGTVQYAGELHRIESATSMGKDPSDGFYKSGNAAENGLVLMARMNPLGAAKVFLANPKLAKTDILCSMAKASRIMEQDRQSEAKLQMRLGMGSAALMVVPGGALVAGGGVLLGVGSTAVGVSRGLTSEREAKRLTDAYSATQVTNFRNEAGQARAAANSEFAGAALAFAAGSAGKAAKFVKFMKSGLAARRATAAEKAVMEKILERAVAASRRGELAIDALDDQGTKAAFMAFLEHEDDITALNRLAANNPKKFNAFLERVRKACSSVASAHSPYSDLAFILPFVSEVAFAGEVCNWAELKNITDEMRVAAGQIKLNPPTAGEQVIMKDANYGRVQDISPTALTELKKVNPAEYEKLKILNRKILDNNGNLSSDTIKASKASPIGPEIRAKAIANQVEIERIEGVLKYPPDGYYRAAIYAKATGNEKLTQFYLGRYAELTEEGITKVKPLTSASPAEMKSIVTKYAEAGWRENLLRILKTPKYESVDDLEAIYKTARDTFYSPNATPLLRTISRKTMESAESATREYATFAGRDFHRRLADQMKTDVLEMANPKYMKFKPDGKPEFTD